MSQPNHKRPPCAGLWNTPMVQVNGDVTTCCLDEHLVNKVGNITEQSLNSIWYSERMNSWRIAQIEERFEDKKNNQTLGLKVLGLHKFHTDH